MVTYSKEVEKWGIQEISINVPEEGNPYIQCHISGIFTGKDEQIKTDGFYDGNGIYKIRFMPSFEGEYQFRLEGSCPDHENTTGSFQVLPPSSDNHGPVHVAARYHFAYEDGTPYYSVGTTCYVWELQSDELVRQTLETINKQFA